MAAWVSGNVYIRAESCETGHVVPGHTHNYDHTTIFLGGLWKVVGVKSDGGTIERVFDARVTPKHCLILATVAHTLTCISGPGSYWCVYSLREPDGSITEEWNGWTPAVT